MEVEVEVVVEVEGVEEVVDGMDGGDEDEEVDG